MVHTNVHCLFYICILYVYMCTLITYSCTVWNDYSKNNVQRHNVVHNCMPPSVHLFSYMCARQIVNARSSVHACEMACVSV